MAMTWAMRAYRADDAKALREVFFSSVHVLASHCYTQPQLDAWAPADYDALSWSDMLNILRPFVVEESAVPVGFADIQRDGSIEMFYVSGKHARRGVGTALMQAIHQRAAALRIESMHSKVSLVAQPFFRSWGFDVIEQRMPVVRGVAMPNALMVKSRG